MDQEINEIQRVINTLNAVKIEGEQNWDAMLACIKHLRAVQRSLAEKNKPVEVADVEVVPEAEE